MLKIAVSAKYQSTECCELYIQTVLLKMWNYHEKGNSLFLPRISQHFFLAYSRCAENKFLGVRLVPSRGDVMYEPVYLCHYVRPKN